MNAASIAAFDRASQKAAEAAFPGRVQIAGVEYAVAMTYAPIERRLSAEDGGGVVIEQGMFFDLRKDLHPAEPKTHLVVQDLDSGEYYIVESVEGKTVTDSCWLVSCSANQE